MIVLSILTQPILVEREEKKRERRDGEREEKGEKEEMSPDPLM